MSERVIPEKWQSVYRQCEEFLAHPGEPSTKPIEWCVQILDDLADLQAKLEEKERQAYKFGFEECRNKALYIVDEHEGFSNRIDLLQLDHPAPNETQEAELQRLRTENAALKRPVKLTVDEAFKLFRIFSQTPCRDGHVKAFEAVITYWRTQEAQKGATE